MLVGCKRPDADVRTVFHGFTPFDSLAGVRLGLTSEELQKLRPVKKPTGSGTGYSEVIGDVPVVYSISDGLGAGSTVPAGMVDAVETVMQYPTDAEAKARFKQLIGQVTERIGSRPKCYAPPLPMTWISAIWERNGQLIYVTGVGISPTRAKYAGPPLTPGGTVRLGMGLRGSIALPEVPDSVSVPCP
jgi:hypothetical protein